MRSWGWIRAQGRGVERESRNRLLGLPPLTGDSFRGIRAFAYEAIRLKIRVASGFSFCVCLRGSRTARFCGVTVSGASRCG